MTGGATRIAQFTEMLVPSMAGLYLLSALIIVVMNIDKVPAMFMLIIHDAFTPQAAVGGGFAAVFMTGVRRGLFPTRRAKVPFLMRRQLQAANTLRGKVSFKVRAFTSTRGLSVRRRHFRFC